MPSASMRSTQVATLYCGRSASHTASHLSPRRLAHPPLPSGRWKRICPAGPEGRYAGLRKALAQALCLRPPRSCPISTTCRVIGASSTAMSPTVSQECTALAMESVSQESTVSQRCRVPESSAKERGSHDS